MVNVNQACTEGYPRPARHSRPELSASRLRHCAAVSVTPPLLARSSYRAGVAPSGVSRQAAPSASTASAGKIAVANMRPVAALTVYDVNTCTTCRALAQLLTERGIDFDTVEYHVTGLTESQLRSLLAKTGAKASELLRAREATAIGLDAAALDDDALISAMVANPALVQRPIVVRGDRAVLARPVDRVLELLDD
jgi:arsenate reductase (glutaredoxin)